MVMVVVQMLAAADHVGAQCTEQGGRASTPPSLTEVAYIIVVRLLRNGVRMNVSGVLAWRGRFRQHVWNRRSLVV
jgi:hypothetical protein